MSEITSETEFMKWYDQYARFASTGEEKTYRIVYYCNRRYFGLDTAIHFIRASSRPEAILKLAHLISSECKNARGEPINGFEVVSNDPELFGNDADEEIWMQIVEQNFENDTLWLEEIDIVFH